MSTEADPKTQERSNQASQQIRRIGLIVATVLVAATIMLGALIALVTHRSAGGMPIMTPDAFRAARQIWTEKGPPSYRIKIRVSGRQAAEYYVEVKDREVVVATRDSMPLRQQRTMGTWSVPGMFGTIESDVLNYEKHQSGTAPAGTPQVLLRAQFDPDFGYPTRYHRTELQKWGNNTEVSWEVVEFHEG